MRSLLTSLHRTKHIARWCRRNARTFVSLLLVALSSSAIAQPLTLEEVLSSVERSYPLINAERQKLAKAEAEALAAKGAFDTKIKSKVDPVTLSKKETYGYSSVFVEQPTTLYGLSLYGGWRAGSGVFPDYYGEYVTEPFGEFFLGAVVPVLQGGAIDEARAYIARSTQELTVASSGVDLKLLFYRFAAAQKYWDWVAAGDLLEIERKLLALAEERDAGIRSRVTQGLLPEFEALDNERLLLSRRAKVLDAELKLQQAALGLSLYWRDQQGRPIVPTIAQLPSWPIVSVPSAEKLPSMISEALAKRPELSIVSAQRAQADVALSLADNQLLPSLDVTLGATQGLNGASELGVGLRFELPIQQRKAEGAVAKAEADQKRADAEYTHNKDMISAEVQLSFAALKTSAEQVGLQEASLNNALRLAEGERTRFDLGSSTILVVNLREVIAAESSAALVESKRRYFTASAALTAALGAL